MSNALRTAAETTAHAISDLVDEARDRIEDLPPIARARRKHNRPRWMALVVAVVLGSVVLMAVRRRRQEDAAEESTTGAFLAEKTLAVS